MTNGLHELHPVTSAYLDSNAVIRFVESDDDLLDPLLERVRTGTLRLYTSEFTLAEVLVQPIQSGDHELVAIYESLLFPGGDLTIVAVDRSILHKSAEIRATIGNKGPDAIHIATAVHSNCTILLSSDQRLRLPDGIRRIDAEAANDPENWE